MSIPTWPAILPCFLRSGYGYQRHNNIESTEFESGYTRSRRKPNGPVTFSGTLRMTDDQLEVFESWVEEELKDVGLFSVQLKSGAGLENWVVKLLRKDFSPKLTDKNRWLVSLSLQARRQKYLSYGDLQFKINNMPEDFGDRIQTIIKRYDTSYYL